MLGHQTQNATPGFFGRTWNGTREIYLFAWIIAAFAFIVLPIPMWIANAYAWDWLRFSLNGSLTLVGTFLIFFYGLRPTNVVGAGGISGLFAQLMDRDGSQGVAAGPALLYRAVLWIGFSYFMLGITLTTWSMQESPGMFWLAYLSIIGLVMVSQLMQWKGRWAPLIAGAYLLGCLGFAVWETTLSNNLEAATGVTWFDDDTGKAVIVGYYNQGKFVPDPRGRSAAKCAASSTGCFYKGIKLVTPKIEDVPDTSGFGFNSVIDAVTKTPAERAAEEAAEEVTEVNSNENKPITVLPTPRAPKFAEVCDGVHAKALGEGRLVECYSGTLFADGEDLILPARDDACFSTNKASLLDIQGIDVLTIDPVTGQQSDGPDGQPESYRVLTRHGNTVTGIIVWYTKNTKTFQRYKCNKST